MIRLNQGNILKVIHETGCTVKQAEDALTNSNSWIEAYKYVKEHE